MKIDLSKEEYRVLLDVLHIAEVVISGHRRQQDERSAVHRKLVQALYARAADAGLGDLFTHHASEGHYHPTDEFEESSPAHEFIDEFVDHTFWDQLITRLTTRDASLEAGGNERFLTMNPGEREAIEQPIHDRYVREFSEHGLENMAVVERFVPAGDDRVETSD